MFLSRYFACTSQMCVLSEFLHTYSIHLNYTKLLSKEYFQIAMILFTFRCFDHHVSLNFLFSLPVSGKNDHHQSQSISGTLDPDVKDVIINFQAYCCVLQDCFPVHPPSRKPIPRKRPAAYKYTGLLFINTLQQFLTASFSCVILAEILCPPPAQRVPKHFHTRCLTWALQPPWWQDGKISQKLCVKVTGNLILAEC